jgi:hypothetical protein
MISRFVVKIPYQQSGGLQMPENQSSPPFTFPGVLLKIFIFALLMFGVVVYATYEQKAEAETANMSYFVAIFGVQSDHPKAPAIVESHLRTLAKDACDSSKRWQVFPVDNEVTELTYKSALSRLDLAKKVALARHHKVPDEVTKFHIPAQPLSGANYEDLKCW